MNTNVADRTDGAKKRCAGNPFRLFPEDIVGVCRKFPAVGTPVPDAWDACSRRLELLFPTGRDSLSCMVFPSWSAKGDVCKNLFVSKRYIWLSISYAFRESHVTEFCRGL